MNMRLVFLRLHDSFNVVETPRTVTLCNIISNNDCIEIANYFSGNGVSRRRFESYTESSIQYTRPIGGNIRNSLIQIIFLNSNFKNLLHEWIDVNFPIAQDANFNDNEVGLRRSLRTTRTRTVAEAFGADFTQSISRRSSSTRGRLSRPTDPNVADKGNDFLSNWPRGCI